MKRVESNGAQRLQSDEAGGQQHTRGAGAGRGVAADGGAGGVREGGVLDLGPPPLARTQRAFPPSSPLDLAKALRERRAALQAAERAG